MYLFFDTETTGLPKNWNAPADQVDNWPRIIQLAWALFDDQGNLQKQACDLIRPNGWEIPKEKFWIDNGYSTEKSAAEGIDIESALDAYIAERQASSYAIAHNMAFDSKIVRAEMIRAQKQVEFTAKKVCTMVQSTNFCKIPNSRGYKWPTLTELHLTLFGCGFSRAHDALHDVRATAKCFFELKNRGVLNLN